MTASSALCLVLVALVATATLHLSTAFAPSSRRSASVSYTSASITKSVGPRYSPVIVNMNAESEAERLKDQAAKLRQEVASATGKTVEEVAAESAPAQQKQVSADGTFYDDDTPEYKDPLSDSMRARLMKEASTGLDSDTKQTNVILYISIAVAILVLLGGQGILY